MRPSAMLPTTLLVLLTSIATVRSSSLPEDAASSGVQIEHTNPVTCSRPTKSGDRISVHYRGRLQSNNVEFDESYKRGKPITFTLGAGEVIKGWDQGLLDMCPGEGRTLTIPPELAYGDRGTGPIPPHSTLIFTTELVDIQGVTQEKLTVTPTAWTFDSNGKMTTETAPATPPTGDEKEVAGLAGEPLHPEQSDVSPEEAGEKKPEKKECQLLGPFALLVQGALGTVAILTLVWKRYREVPKRPWKIFIFDVSKQVLGSILTHIVNLAMSMTGSMAIINAAQKAAEGHAAAAAKDGDVRMPNPCSFYLLNLGMDTTIGIFILYILLKVLHALFLRTPLARPPQSLTSGNYDSPPRWEWWAKQLLIYCIGLLGMKLCVFFLFQALPWLPWVGDWALRWTKGNEALEITFAMFVFPLAMNAVQYWVIDNLIKGRENKEKSGFSDAEYERVQGQEDDDEGGDGRFMNDSFSDGHQRGQVERSKGLEEVNPTPIPAYEEEEPLQSRHKQGESSQ